MHYIVMDIENFEITMQLLKNIQKTLFINLEFIQINNIK